MSVMESNESQKVLEEVFYPQQHPPDEYDEERYLIHLDKDNDEQLRKLSEPLLFRPDDALASFTASQDFDPVKRVFHRTKLRPIKPPERDDWIMKFRHSSFSDFFKENLHKWRRKRGRAEGYLVRKEKGLTQCNIPPDDGHIFTYLKRTEALQKHMNKMLKKDNKRSPATDAHKSKYNYNACIIK